MPFVDHSRNEMLETATLTKKSRIDSVVLRCVACDPTGRPVPLSSVWYGLCSQNHGLVSADRNTASRLHEYVTVITNTST
jgi:hypothetical protein